MILPIGSTWYGEFSTRNTAGALANATTATAALVVNGDDTAVTVTITQLSGLGAGWYEASCTLAGRAAGNVCLVRLTVTCDGVTDTAIIGEFVIGPVAATVAAGGITNNSFAAGAITSSAIINGAFLAAKFASQFITSTSFAGGAITNTSFATGAITATALAAETITAASIAPSALASGKFGVGAIGSPVIADGAFTAAKFGTACITSAKIDTTALTAVAAAVWNALVSGITTVNSIGKRLVDFVTGDIFGRLGAPAGASVSADVAAVKAETAAIAAKTGNLPASPAASGEYTAAIADIPTVAEFEARSLPAADYTVVGDLSGLSTLDAAGVRAALGMASANLDTQIGTLATAASIVTLGGYIDTEVASILAIVNSGTHGNAALLTAIGNIEGGTATIDAQDVADALKLAPAAGSPASGSVYELLNGIQTTVSASSGSGIRSVTITVTDGTDPLEGAKVNLIEGINSYVGTTDADGEVVFTSIQDATFAVRIAKPGYTFTEDELVVDGNEVEEYEMTAIATSPPAAPNCSTGVITCLGTSGAVQSGVTITFKHVTTPTTDGYAYDGREVGVVSDSNGIVQYTGFIRGGTYKAKRGNGTEVEFTVADVDSFTLPEMLGRP